jgi:hypothetical protein
MAPDATGVASLIAKAVLMVAKKTVENTLQIG